MNHIEFEFTRALSTAECHEYLKDTQTGVLGLCDAGVSYSVPVAHVFDNEQLYFRLGFTPTSKKSQFIETTETASYVVFSTQPTSDPSEIESWSIQIVGKLSKVVSDAKFDDATINKTFPPIRVFGESIDEIEIELYCLRISQMTGRTTD